MIDNFEYIGLWWLPENPNNQLYGTLKFIHNEKAILEVLGNFQGHINDPLSGILNLFNGGLMQPEIIHGFTVDGKLITLYRCHMLAGNVTVPGIPKQSFKIQVILEGYHFQKPKDIKFKQISVHYSYLNEWVNISGFKRLVKDDKWEDLAYQYDKPENISLTNNEDYEIFVNFDSTHLRPHFGKELIIKQQSYITIKTLNEDISYDKSVELIELIQDFLTFGTMETVYPLNISGELEPEGNSDKIHVSIILCFLKIPDSVKISSVDDMLFSFKDIKENINFSLTNWINNANNMKYIYGLYFNTLYDTTYLENRFLNYIMAIEGYHRSIEKNVDLSNNEHKQRIKDILDAVGKVSEDHKQWLSGRLQHSNEPELKKRLNTILADYHDIFGGEEKFEEFVNFVYDTRNTLVHPQGTEHSTVNTNKLHNYTEILKLAVAICLLNILDFKVEDIKKIIPKMQRNMFKIP